MGGVHDELGAFGLVEDPLDDQPVTGRECSEHGETHAEVDDHLICDLFGDTGFLTDMGTRSLSVAGREHRLEMGAQPRSPRRRAPPSGRAPLRAKGMVGGRSPASAPHGSGLDLLHPPGVGAEEEDVARGGLHHEVLVHRADRRSLGIEDDPVVACFGDGAPVRRGGSRPAPCSQPSVDHVVMEVRPPPAPAGLDQAAELDHLVEGFTFEPRVGRGAGHQLVERVDFVLLGRGDLGDDLLGQHVERCDQQLEEVEVTPALTAASRAVHSTSSSRVSGYEAAGRGPLDVVVGPTHPLEEGADGPRGADLADQLDRADVDAQLERGGGDEGPEVTGPEPVLDDAPAGADRLPWWAATWRAASIGSDVPGPVGSPTGAVSGPALRRP